jgi:hypothetical protein
VRALIAQAPGIPVRGTGRKVLPRQAMGFSRPSTADDRAHAMHRASVGAGERGGGALTAGYTPRARRIGVVRTGERAVDVTVVGCVVTEIHLCHACSCQTRGQSI